MHHFEFIDKVSQSVIALDNLHTGLKKYEVVTPVTNQCNFIIKDGHDLKWETNDPYNDLPLKTLIKMAIDMDTWKHSQHLKIDENNYERFIPIIQNKIIDRSKEIEFLLDVYFLIKNEIANEPK